MALVPERRRHHPPRRVVPVLVEVLALVERQVLDQRLAPHPLAQHLRPPDRLVGILAGDVHDIERHPRHVGDHDRAVGRLALDLRRPRIGVRLRPGVALGHQPRLELRHDVAVLGMDERDRPELRAAPERREQLVVVDHQRALVGHEVLEGVDPALGHRLHLVEDLLAPPRHRHVERIVAMRPGGLVVPHLQRVEQRLPRARQREVDDHRRPPRQRRPRAAVEVVRRVGPHERHLEVGMRVDPPRHHQAPARVEHGVPCQIRPDGGDPAALDQNVRRVAQIGGDDRPALDDRRHEVAPF